MPREIELLVDGCVSDALSDALLAAGALAVAVEDAHADTAAETPQYGEPGLAPALAAWSKNRLIVLLDAGSDPRAVVDTAARSIDQTAPSIVATRLVGDADWVRLTQAQFPPTRVGDRLWIVPTWHELPDPGAINIRLDPGVAFGTGAHPTTRLCLAWLEAEPLAGKRVLDYGCGSGILAITAAKLGASEVIGTDIDPQALEAARANTRLNGVTARYTAPDQLPDHKLSGRTFDVVLANILSNPLKVLAPALAARVASGGALVLSGVLKRQAAELIDTYAKAAPELPLIVWGTEDDWVCLVGRHR